MSFIDEAKVFVKGGNGGNGCVSFRREKYIEFGGPDGGNGGDGGSIILEASSAVNTLLFFRYHQHLRAENGKSGSGKKKSGASGRDLVIKVPIGTQVFDSPGGSLIADLSTVGQRYVVASGGKGGVGNAQYKSSTNRAPVYYTLGAIEEEFPIFLQLKVLSDIGIIGMPNAGKSSLLSRCTMSKTKVADYPFTTLEPHLGVARINEYDLILADIPGLIENANEGAGLGHKFLKHIERCSLLLHLIDGSTEDIVGAYKLVSRELAMYSKELSEKREVIVLNKCDMITEEEIVQKKHLLEDYSNKTVVTLSLDDPLNPLLVMLYEMLQKDDIEEESKKFDPFLHVGYNKKKTPKI
ncbi:GTPase CgtA [Anaplasma phagocytophilum str. MRK]|uniref:Obg family GTPase CgtA n=1 Tax=Anaplasma phagocytophilum TaxID=948 RepID=UPI0005339E96|nr:GTPase ObgE [Anaplasma phagocytophilum]KDB55984.1 GTPase CgtA [Anaplasma phagocytophilum str. MRK]